MIDAPSIADKREETILTLMRSLYVLYAPPSPMTLEFSVGPRAKVTLRVEGDITQEVLNDVCQHLELCKKYYPESAPPLAPMDAESFIEKIREILREERRVFLKGFPENEVTPGV